MPYTFGEALAGIPPRPEPPPLRRTVRVESDWDHWLVLDRVTDLATGYYGEPGQVLTMLTGDGQDYNVRVPDGMTVVEFAATLGFDLET